MKDDLTSHTDGLIAQMSLEQKVGQLLMLAFDEGSLEEGLTELHAGSLIVWKQNVRGPGELAALANRIQTINASKRELPVWLHGFAEDLGWSGAWHASLPTVATLEEVERLSAIFGRRWRSVGLHNFPAPTLNVVRHETNIMRDWSMTGDTDMVTRYGAATTRGLVSARCGTMAQHFPAHGATPIDSHAGFPVVDLSRESLLREHIQPYVAAFAAGCTSICTAHLACPALDPDPTHVATTSRPILKDFLRRELGFNGIVIADAISMKGFHKNGPPEALSVDAIVAGCDSICISSTGALQRQVFDAVLAAARSGVITPHRLDEAVGRHVHFLDWLGVLDAPHVDPERAEAVFADPDNMALLADINARLGQR